MIFLYFQLGEELLSESEGRTPPINKYWLGLHSNQNHHQYQYYHRLNQDYGQIQVQIQVKMQDKLPDQTGPNCPKILFHQQCVLARATSIVQVQNQIYKYKLAAPNKSLGTVPKWKIIDMHMLLLVIMAMVVVGCMVITATIAIAIMVVGGMVNPFTMTWVHSSPFTRWCTVNFVNEDLLAA